MKFQSDVVVCPQALGVLRTHPGVAIHLGLDQASRPRNRSPPETLFEHSSNLF